MIRIYLKNKFMNKFSKYLDSLTKIIAITTAVGVVFGLLVAYAYLDFIQHKSLFVNVLSQPASFVTIIFVFSLIVFLFFLGFCTPYKLALSYKENNIYLSLQKNIDKKFLIHFKSKLFWVFLLPSIIAILMSCLILLIFYCEFWEKELRNLIAAILFLLGVFSSFIIFSILWLIEWHKTKKIISKIRQEKKRNGGSVDKVKLRHFKNKFTFNEGMEIAFDNFLVSFTTVFSIFLIFVPMIGFWIEDEDLQWWILGISIVVMFLNSVLASFLLYRDSPTKGGAVFGFPLLLAFCFFVVISKMVTGIHQKLLYPARFVEIAEDSSWYILHNNYQINNKYREINGINTYDLERLKTNFFRCRPNKKNPCSDILNQRQNALYGYMAWNLGNIKVFCPQHVKFTKDIEKNKILAEKCLTINSEFIQPLSGQYIVPNYTARKETISYN
ncbi:hypothetical protein l11_03230 [Neisseria weaveri LMG 5135]|nr:hypothetical protein l11_03230 [Neisseria weaveri LMG 5135]